MYTLATVEADGMIRCAQIRKIVHRESLGIPEWGTTCYDKLQDAKEQWAGPEGNTVILTLDRGTGACTGIYMGEAQRETLVPRLNKWRGCYGAWPIKKLNV